MNQVRVFAPFGPPPASAKAVTGTRQRHCGFTARPLHVGLLRSAIFLTGLGFAVGEMSFNAKAFLSGKSTHVQKKLGEAMSVAARPVCPPPACRQMPNVPIERQRYEAVDRCRSTERALKQ
jgi:hypothetical protein